MPKKKILSNLQYTAGFFIILLFSAALLCARFGLDLDLLWHIRMGEDIVRNHEIISENTYSWLQGTYWNQQEWLYDVIIYAVISFTGLIGYHLIFALSEVSLIGIGFRQHKSKIHYPILYFVISAFILTVVPTNAMNRPSDYSTFIFVFLFWLYEGVSAKKLLVYFFSGLFIGNFHCGTVITATAFMILHFVLDAVSEIILKDKAGNFNVRYVFYRILSIVLFIAGSCINPLGPKQLLNMLTATSLDTLSYIDEWKPLRTDNFMIIMALVIVILSFGYALKGSWKKRDVIRIGILSAFLVLTLYSLKSSIIFIYLYIVYGYEYTETMFHDFILQFSKPADWNAGIRFTKKLAIPAVILGIAASCITFYYAGHKTFDNLVYDTQKSFVSDDIIDYLEKHDDERLLHGYSMSNYLLWNDISVFVDSRQHPYSKEFGCAESMDDVVDMTDTKSYEIMDEYFEKYQFTEVLTDSKFDINWYMCQRDDFELIYDDKDTKSALWVKK